MLDVIKKKEYFEWLDRGIADSSNQSLKGIQDAWILSLLSEKLNLKIAEVGGGKSRVLEKLAATNECWNIDKFEGLGAGPTDLPEMPSIKIVRSYLGDFDPALPDNYFDVVFSVSVVEHVTRDKLDSFFADCHRILKPGGTMAHAIDLYIYDEPSTRLSVIDYYRKGVEDHRFDWFSSPLIDHNLTFQCCFATNSDVTMNAWNRIAPSLREIRETAQSISLKLLALKKHS
jgi:ubiquinone/menaquinone biosynthesis C-methylase UbiE